MLKFRELYPDEIEIRPSKVGDGWATLLLYKDARVDMTILDESVGPMNWQKDYQIIDGQLFCTISVWDSEKQQWIRKQDVGTSGDTEPEKSRASDAQKRAASCFGIGRSLYSAPRIRVEIHTEYKNGKWQIPSNANLFVSTYTVIDGKISKLVICEKDGHIIFDWSDKRGCVHYQSTPAELPEKEKNESIFDVVAPDDNPLPFDDSGIDYYSMNTTSDDTLTANTPINEKSARVISAKIEQSQKGMLYMEIEYSMRYNSQTKKQFQPLHTAFGIQSAVKTIHGMNILTDEELAAIGPGHLENLHGAMHIINEHKNDYDYEVDVKTNAKGYPCFDVIRI